ncbi:hypothetical protein EfmAA290_24690 [Enterococcus faecium]|nr:hypothetical protein EfmAA290_24690 [Enterococcus faecium]
MLDSACGPVRKQLKNIKPQDWFVSITNIGMFFIFSKVWNGQNFSFQSSGRIITAFYGADFAYLQGLLLIILKSWFIFTKGLAAL